MKIAAEGIVAFKVFLVPAIAFYVIGRKFGIAFYVPAASALFLAAFSLFFFRDPERKAVPDESVFYSPADGRVIEARSENGVTSVKIFMSVFNVHVQRQPVTAALTGTKYSPGQFKNAVRLDAGEINENNEASFVTKEGTAFTVKQIAGLIARRIRFYRKDGETVGQGERIGIIYFGSQVDLRIESSGIELLAKEGQNLTAGVTPVARISGR